MFLSWWHSVVQRIHSTAKGRGRNRRRRSRPQPRAPRPWAEVLEDRNLLATSAFYSMPTNLSANQGTVVTVPVTIDHLFDAAGDQGLSGALVVLTYDQTAFSVS